MNGEVRVVDDVARAFADFVLDAAPASIALSGGATATAAYRELAARKPDLSALDVFFGDERFVAVSSPDSNEGAARSALLDRCPPRVVHSMVAGGNGPALAAAAYDALIAASAPIDLVHLGLGPDGHTASLFPGSPALAVADRFVVETSDEEHPHPRLTFTYPALTRARSVVVTVAGAEKAAAFAAVRDGRDVPATRVRNAHLVWLVDRAAAGER